LRLTTIGACDMPTATRKRIVAKQKADRSRERKAAERRAKGIKPRPLGDRAAAEAATLGISRSELYRRRKQARDANGHTSVTCTPIGVAVGVQSEGPVRAARKPPAWVLRALDNPICIVPAEHRPETARIGLLVAAQAAAVRAASIGRAA
ncbi:MAG: hypothetical protein LCH80_01235, partial [Proteobacteria bacterium]|nr:hypothetical protein [Pseudomonadota bacterium]